MESRRSGDKAKQMNVYQANRRESELSLEKKCVCEVATPSEQRRINFGLLKSKLQTVSYKCGFSLSFKLVRNVRKCSQKTISKSTKYCYFNFDVGFVQSQLTLKKNGVVNITILLITNKKNYLAL